VRHCGGILKSDTISFGQALVPEVIDRAMQAAAEAICSFQSVRAAGLSDCGGVPAAKHAGARVVIVNAEQTPFDGIADAALRDSIARRCPHRRNVRRPARLMAVRRGDARRAEHSG